ncbi:uncharacterized protein BDZ99DRAFT_567606 [Mytilinidion resinicola]|uniref:Uncharacterized protein n=1 Tax=Mytilinidion resinicola TaxID=574789 RepID=A0A6A6YZG3_9PEZI|nr:uncharacterized protein BDZ99DRAFT_567606 [Mytilinidion resinicola]KAF2813889.1 hypothetical protein BDZ99DRAFT_567606 [Mytilinidion resinicola]
MASSNKKMSGTIEQSATGPRQTVTHLWVSNVDGPVLVRDAVPFFFRGHYLYDAQGRPVEPVTFRNPNNLTFRLARNAQNIPPFNRQNGPNNAGPANAPPANAFAPTNTTFDQAVLLNRPASNPSTAPTPSLTYSDSTISTQPRRGAPPSQGSAVASDVAAVENNLPMSPTLATAFGGDETLFDDTPAMQAEDGDFVVDWPQIYDQENQISQADLNAELALRTRGEEDAEAWVEALIVEAEGDAEARALRSKKQEKGVPPALRGNSGNIGGSVG